MKGGENLRFLPRSKLKREKNEGKEGRKENERKEGGRKRIEEKKANKEQIGSKKKKKTMKMVKNRTRLDKHFHDFEREEKSCLSRLT